MITEIIDALENYAVAAHWYVEANKWELEEKGETREEARDAMLRWESELLKLGYHFRKGL